MYVIHFGSFLRDGPVAIIVSQLAQYQAFQLCTRTPPGLRISLKNSPHAFLLHYHVTTSMYPHYRFPSLLVARAAIIPSSTKGPLTVIIPFFAFRAKVSEL